MKIEYPVDILEADDGCIITFPDLPYGVTCGDTREEALHNAIDCLQVVIEGLIADDKRVPPPSPANGRATVALNDETVAILNGAK